jgi:hypothetical protein
MALTEGKYPGDWLKEEYGAPNYCRKEITVKSGQNLVSGQVLAADGSDQTAFEDDTATPATGILVFAVDASDGALPGVMICRGPVIVNKEQLTWHTDNDATDITNGLADLLALGIVAAEGA